MTISIGDFDDSFLESAPESAGKVNKELHGFLATPLKDIDNQLTRQCIYYAISFCLNNTIERDKPVRNYPRRRKEC